MSTHSRCKKNEREENLHDCKVKEQSSDDMRSGREGQRDVYTMDILAMSAPFGFEWGPDSREICRSFV